MFAESRDRVHKERAMRQRQLKGLVKRLKQLQQMKFNDTRQLLRWARPRGVIGPPGG